MLRAGWAVERCPVVRGISISLQRGREPSAPLDPRGLADCTLAAARRSRPGDKPTEESALRTLPLEDLRQSSSQSRAFGTDAPDACGLDGLVTCMAMDPGGDRDPSHSSLGCLS